MLTKTRKWLITPTLKPYQLILVVLGIMAVIFMDTELYDTLPDFGKVLFYGGVITLCALAGVSIWDIKQIARKFKEVMEKKDMNLWARIQALMRIGIEALSLAGEDWDVFTDEQFEAAREDAKQEEIVILRAEIKKLEADLKK